MTEPGIRIGALGAGGFGLFALQHFAQIPGVKLVGMASTHREAAYAMAQRFGFDMTGKLLDEYPDPEMRAIIDASYRDVVQRAAPVMRQRDLFADGRIFVYEVAILPMTVDGERVEMLLSCIDFDARRAR